MNIFKLAKYFEHKLKTRAGDEDKQGPFYGFTPLNDEARDKMQRIYDDVHNEPRLHQADAEEIKILHQVQKAILDVFKPMYSDDLAEIIDKSVILSKNDPGENAPESIVTIYTEHGLPDDSFNTRMMEEWDKVRSKLEGLLLENVNSAVKAVYNY